MRACRPARPVLSLIYPSIVYKGLCEFDNAGVKLMFQFAYNHGLWWRLSTKAERLPVASKELVLALVNAGAVFDGSDFVKLNYLNYKELIQNRFDLNVQVIVGDKVYMPLRRVEDFGFAVEANGRLNFCSEKYDTDFCTFVNGPIRNKKPKSFALKGVHLKKIDEWRANPVVIDTDGGSLDCSTVLVNKYV